MLQLQDQRVLDRAQPQRLTRHQPQGHEHLKDPCLQFHQQADIPYRVLAGPFIPHFDR